jgi:hypothetical protein
MDSETTNDDLRPEYDESVFANSTRGKYAARFRDGSNIVRIAPDLAATFPNEQAVNDALRFVQQIAQDAGRLTNPGA